MEFFKQNTQIDFFGIRRWTALVSLVLIIASLACLGIKGLNWGLDFTGGYALQINYPHAADLGKIRSELKTAGFDHYSVITFGSSKNIRLTLAPDVVDSSQAVNTKKQTAQDILRAKVQKALGARADIVSLDYTGPSVGKQLAQHGVLAMLIALLATMVYIAMRFEMRFALSAAIALAHDPIIILGVFSYFQLRFDLVSLAAILAVIGYSLNDTVVIYDRVRENFRKLRKASVIEVLNRSINETLSRTIITSGLTLLVVVVLFFFGGPTIHWFSLALILGVIIGTYSSIYVAGALAVLFGLDRQALLPQAKQVDDRP